MPFLGVAGIGGLVAFMKPGTKPTVFGGNLSEDSTYYYRTFLASNTLTVVGGVLSADVLVVAGGGSGGPGYGSGRGGGGGGAGGMKQFALLLSGDSAVTVGAGGAGILASPTNSGTSSSISTASTTGGGGGGHGAGGSGQNGGSGGGNGGYDSIAGLGISGQGNNGGTTTRQAYADPSAGGGGAGGAGGTPAGGAGLTSAVSGTSTTYAIGGTGGSQQGAEAGASGAASTGNGGNGGGGTGSIGVYGGVGGNGGSGIVVVRYLKTAVKESTDAFEHIATIYGTGTSPVISFNGIPASQYKHLQLRVVGQVSSGGATDLYLKFNNDSTNGNYRDHRMYGFNNTMYSGTVSTNSIYCGTVGAVGDTASVAAVVIDLVDPFSTSKNKTLKYFGGKPATDNYVVFGSGLWLSTSPVTSIQVSVPSGSFTTASRFSLYGSRG